MLVLGGCLNVPKGLCWPSEMAIDCYSQASHGVRCDRRLILQGKLGRTAMTFKGRLACEASNIHAAVKAQKLHEA